MNEIDKKNFDFLSEIISENDVLIDVGSNQGEYTSFFLDLIKETGKIISIELHPNTSKDLENKFKSNKNIKVLNCAVSDIDGEIEYFAGVDSFTNNIIGHDMNYKKNVSLGRIKSIRLDTLLENENKIKLIKIDVEGAEISVLKGLKNKIEIVDNILVECHLDEDWSIIKNLLINEYNMDCLNILENKKIVSNSLRSYQCLCKKKI